MAGDNPRQVETRQVKTRKNKKSQGKERQEDKRREGKRREEKRREEKRRDEKRREEKRREEKRREEKRREEKRREETRKRKYDLLRPPRVPRSPVPWARRRQEPTRRHTKTSKTEIDKTKDKIQDTTTHLGCIVVLIGPTVVLANQIHGSSTP